ncbi:MAG: hypothetical protein AOA65_0409 [Candidatus Bathyarchaeota archaeon BA1]|nr:MAG: hypothetical protein AOA65_0409 [Candidatus Bathyarchaeota archaeon BA1]
MGEKASQERPDGWWRDPPQSEWILDRGHEPTTFELFHDFIIGKAVTTPEAVAVASMPPSRLIQFDITHPRRGVEYVRLFLSPTDVLEGPAEEEPDLTIRMNYYDLVAILLGELSVMGAFWGGKATVIGNLTAGIDLFDTIQAIHKKGRTPRPDFWPSGHP